MPIDDRDEKPPASSLPEKEREVEAALQSETDAPLPPAAERAAERDADRPEPKTPQGKRRKFLTRRNALIATIGIAAVLVLLVLVVVIAYRLGYIDRYIANQIKGTLAQYGIRAEIKHFETQFGPRTVEMRDIELYDEKTGEKLGKIDRILATVRIDDLYAISLNRNVKLQDLQVDGLEIWVRFDADGNSNFRNLRLPPPEPNKRILFSYSTATAKINGAVIHYGDERHDFSGEARNVVATISPDDPNAPEESRMNRVVFTSTNSTFVYDGRPVNQIDISARGRVNQTRAEIEELILRSPIAEAHLSGVMDDWRNLRYKLNLDSTVDLTQASDILQTGTTFRGVGNAKGTVTGEGSRYQVDGEIKADALAADGIRLQGLNVTGQGSGEGKTYDINARAVAELLTAGDFQLNLVQLTGNVMGTGSDFRWLGDLRAAAARTPYGSVAGLILSDATAEARDNVISYSASGLNANVFNAAGARVNNVRASSIHGRTENGVTVASIAGVQTGAILSSGARIDSLSTNSISIVSRGGVTNVETDNLRVGGVDASGAKVGSLNIAGVRLAIRDGRIEGRSGDINAGTVSLAKSADFAGGRIDDVRLARPVFTAEPSGRYRVTADLSLGGGVLGQINLGSARAGLVATNGAIQLNNFDANIMSGRATGNATLATTRGGGSRVITNFSDLDIGSLVATLTARQNILITGKASGMADLSFPGSNLGRASGTARAELKAETGDEASGRTPVNGEVALHADRGLFTIDRADIRTPDSQLNATGQFSIERDESNLQLNLASNDAAELQRVLFSTGLFYELEDQFEKKQVKLAGKFTFNGTLRGRLKEPNVEGRASLDTLMMSGRDLGSLAANLNTTSTEVRITEGRLTERDGGGVQFALNIPIGEGAGSASIDATLDRVNAGNLTAALSAVDPKLAQFGNIESDVSGRINVTGIPDAMAGNAELRFAPGRIGDEPFQSILAQATFSGSIVNLNNVVAQLDAGRVEAKGTFNTGTQALDIQAVATGIQIERLARFAPNAGALPTVTGTANLNAHISGVLTGNDFSSFDINFDGEGRDVRINGRPAGPLTLVGRTQNKLLDITLTTGLLGNAQQQVIARVDLGTEGLATRVESTLVNADLTNLFAIIYPENTVRMTGSASGTLRAEGNLINENAVGETEYSLAGLKGTANFTDLTIQIEDVQLVAVSPLLVQFSTDEVYFEKTQFTGTNTNVSIGGRFALGPKGTQSLSVVGSLNLKVLNGISPDLFLTGSAEVNVRVAGTYEQPRINGTAFLANASAAPFIADQRLVISNVKGVVRFNNNQAQIDQLTGMLGGGRVTVSGGVLLDRLTPARIQLNVHGDDVTVPYPEDFRSTADVELEIRGSTTRGQQLATIISGTINLRRAEYTKDIDLETLISRRREGLIEQGGEFALAATAQFQDLRIEGRDALVVRNNLAETVGSVSLRINGPVKEPIVSGRITATSGTLNFRNNRHDIQRATVDLPGRLDADPILNIQTIGEIQGYDVITSITGPLTQPTVTVRSDPSLPQADVVSLILTGQLSTGETGTSALAQSGLGTAASLLTESLISAPARRATDKLFGLNRFEIDPLVGGRGGESPTARLTVGRQINKNLSITYSTNVTSNQNQVLAVEYRVSNRLSFVAQYEQGSTTGFSSRNDNFSFEIRLRKRF